jgi:hypothetical protein
MSNLLLNNIDLEFLKLLLQHKTRYLIVGSYALRQYDYLRVASDLDVWVDIAGCNPVKLIDTLEASPYTSLDGINIDELYKPFKEIKLWGHLVNIELLTSLGNMDFDLAYADRETSSDGLPVISAKHLLEAKRISINHRQNEIDRLKDDDDIKQLEFYLDSL